VRPQTPIKERKVPKQQIIKTAPSAMPSSDKANATLDRIEIPHDAIQQISELLIPGFHSSSPTTALAPKPDLARISSC